MDNTTEETTGRLVRLYRCRKGHSFRTYVPLVVTFGGAGDSLYTGPLCPGCVVGALNELAPAQEVLEP
jgi:hypothetical protein